MHVSIYIYIYIRMSLAGENVKKLKIRDSVDAAHTKQQVNSNGLLRNIHPDHRCIIRPAEPLRPRKSQARWRSGAKSVLEKMPWFFP